MAAQHFYPFNALQKAAFVKLSADVSGASVVDDTAGKDYPLVVLGDHTSERVSSAGGSTNNVTLEVDVLSTASANKECNDLMDQVVQALTEEELDLSDDGFEARWLNVEGEFRREYDGQDVVRHGVVRVTWMIDKT